MVYLLYNWYLSTYKWQFHEESSNILQEFDVYIIYNY